MRVVFSDREIVRFPTQRTAALLAYLAMHPGKHFLRETVAELLWPEGDPRAVRNRLNQAVSSLRRILHRPDSGVGVLEANHQHLRLAAQNVSTDVSDFYESCRLARGNIDAFARENWLRRAYDLYRGELLEGFYDDWLFTPRLNLAQLFNEVTVALAELYLERGHIDEAIAVGMRRLELDPADESAHLTVIQAQLSAGRLQFARRQWEALVQALSSLQLAPSSAAMQIAERFGRTESIPSPATRAGALRERVTERGRRAPPLPIMGGRFFGRRAELEALIELLSDDTPGPITLAGLPGVGKTRLALEIASSRADRFGNVAFVSAGPEAPRAVADAAGIEDAGDDVVLLAERLAAGGGALVVVDGASASDAEWVEALATAAPGVRVLVTARRPLKVPSERLMPLPPLGPCRRDASIHELAEHPAAQLFVARAQAKQPDFQVTTRNYAAIRALIQRLEGHPLALETAARLARVLTPRQMLDELVNNFKRFAARETQERRSLEARLEAGWVELDSDLRIVATRLAGFVREFDALYAAEILGGHHVAESIAELEVGGWVQADADGEEARFRLPWLVREFIASRTDPDVREEVAARVSRSTIARLKEGRGVGGEDAAAAVTWLLETDDAEESASVAIEAGRLLAREGRLVESRKLLENVRDRLRGRTLSATSVGRLALTLGMTCEFLGERAYARKLYSQAAEHLGAEMQDAERYELAFAEARLAHGDSRYEAARAILSRLIDETPPPDILQRAWLGTGNALVEEGDFEGAHQAYVESLAQAERVGALARATVLCNLANLAVIRADAEAARLWLREASDLSCVGSLPWVSGVILLVEARLARLEGDLEAGRRALSRLVDLEPEELTLTVGAIFECTHVSDDPVAAAKLIGFGKGYVRRLGNFIVGRQQDALCERTSRLAETLGAKRFEQLVRIGEAMSWEQAWQLARQQVGPRPLRCLI